MLEAIASPSEDSLSADDGMAPIISRSISSGMDDIPGRLDIDPKVGRKWEIRIESPSEVDSGPGLLFRKKRVVV
jgi:hypothetical protein